ncbi:MAG: hypothetical protein OHK0046_21850 [Anaerolineae bacterium]
MTENVLPTQEEMTYCAVHPDRETGLRCNKCDRYMCGECAVQTPVGYRCKQCVRQVEDRYFTAQSTDYAIIFTVIAGLSAVAGAIMSAVGFVLIAIFAAYPVGMAMAGYALRLTEKRRGRQSALIGAAAVLVGGFFGAAARLFFVYNDRYGEAAQTARQFGIPFPDLQEFILNNTVGDIGLLVFVALAAAAVYSRYRV